MQREKKKKNEYGGERTAKTLLFLNIYKQPVYILNFKLGSLLQPRPITNQM